MHTRRATTLPTPSHTIHPPLTAVTPTDQTGIIAILTGFSLGLILLSSVVRLYARRSTRIARSDDVAFYSAVTIALAQTGLVLYLVSAGLGKSVEALEPAAIKTLEQGGRAAALLYIVVLFLSKALCGLMFVWLTPYDEQKRAARVLIAASVVWVVSSLGVEGAGCRDVVGRCAGFVSSFRT